MLSRTEQLDDFVLKRVNPPRPVRAQRRPKAFVCGM